MCPWFNPQIIKSYGDYSLFVKLSTRREIIQGSWLWNRLLFKDIHITNVSGYKNIDNTKKYLEKHKKTVAHSSLTFIAEKTLSWAPGFIISSFLSGSCCFFLLNLYCFVVFSPLYNWGTQTRNRGEQVIIISVSWNMTSLNIDKILWIGRRNHLWFSCHNII